MCMNMSLIVHNVYACNLVYTYTLAYMHAYIYTELLQMFEGCNVYWLHG